MSRLGIGGIVGGEINIKCATCVHSSFAMATTHVCHERGDMAVAADYNCEAWRPMVMDLGRDGELVFGEDMDCAC